MRNLRLYFPYYGQRLLTVEYALLLLGMISLLTVAYQFKQIMTDIAYWEGREARIALQQKYSRQSKTPMARVNKATQQEIKQVNDVLQQLGLPWEQLFGSLEMANSKEVALLSFQPGVSGQTVHLTGEARNLAALVAYVQALELESALKDVHLASYKTRQDHPHHPLVFSITATWHKPS